jgi:hypothetical protein
MAIDKQDTKMTNKVALVIAGGSDIFLLLAEVGGATLRRKSKMKHVKLLAALGALVLGACAAPDAPHDGHANMDPAAHCEMHKQMMSSMTPQQQQAMMDEHMKDMSPEMRARMQEMHARCKPGSR